MLCEQVMNRNVKFVDEKDTAQSAARMMRDANVGFLPVCTTGGKVVGTVTDRDIVVRAAADTGALSSSVSSVMTREVISCKPKDDLRRAEQLMEDHHKSRIVCIDEQNRPVGVISLSDIAQHEDGAQLSKLMRAISSREVRRS